MTVLAISKADVAAGRMGEDSVREAVRAIEEDGFVVLEQVIDREHLSVLRERMLDDVKALLRRDDAPFNFNRGNIQQDPPPFPPYLFRDVLLNDLVIQVTRAVLGPGLKNTYYSGNTALPGGPRQPVHPDSGQLWPNLEHPTPAYSLVVNVPVVDMTPENGGTEIWPGTHRDTAYSVHEGAPRIPDEALDRQRAIRPPLQPSVSCGGVLIRDIRLWHAGMPNRTGVPRPMIAMIHSCGWYGSDELVFPCGTERFFEHPHLRTAARFVNPPIDYLKRHQAHDLREDPPEESPGHRVRPAP